MSVQKLEDKLFWVFSEKKKYRTCRFVYETRRRAFKTAKFVYLRVDTPDFKKMLDGTTKLFRNSSL